MIEHTIIKHKIKRKWEPHVVLTEVNRPPVCTLPIQPTQADYNLYLASCPLKRGDYIISRSYPECVNIYSIWVIIGQITMVSQVRKWYNGHPQHLIVMQIEGHTTSVPWTQAVNHHEYRLLTTEEHQKWVEPRIDSVRDRIQKHQFDTPI